MYDACLFCSAPLAANDEIAHQPVGRRLAFDSHRGRLWVVCPRCGRWNLMPLEERWEAVEECEEKFRSSAERYTKDGVGVARLGGVELIRIGEAFGRRELAAWRYADRYTSRFWRAKALIATMATTVIGAGGATLALGFGLTPAFAASVAVFVGWERILIYARRGGIVARLPDPDGTLVAIKRGELEDDLVRLGRVAPAEGGPTQFYLRLRDGPRLGLGDNAAVFHALGRISADAAVLGAVPSLVEKALAEVAGAAGLEAYLARAIFLFGRHGEVPLNDLPAEVQLAIDMLLNDESERRYLEGELADLRRAWQEAEAIAAIADDLLLPARVSAFLDRHRGGTRGIP